MHKIVRITTIPNSLGGLLKGQLRYMSTYYDMIGVACEEAVVGSTVTLAQVAEAENIRYFPVEMTRQITPLQDLKAVWALYVFLKREKPAIVHSHTPKAGTVAMLAAKLAGVPHRLHTIAGMPLLVATGAKRKLLNLVEKATYACATKIYPNSNGQYKIIQDLGFAKAEKLKVIGKGSSNGIDTTHFDPALYTENQKQAFKKDLDYTEDDFVFIYVGRLVTDKGINELIAAFTKLSTKHENIKLLLVGTHEKELDPLLSKTDHEIDHHPHIKCTGWVTDVRPYLSVAHALVFPSYREGFPNVVMQAGAMGLPSIVTNINGCNEIVTNAKNGFIIPVKDAEAVYEKMELLLTQKSVLTAMASQARETICANYERTYIWKCLHEEYESLLANKN